MGLTSSIPHPELNGPIIENPIFPEEYTLETTTGLVPVVTLQSIGRVKTIQEEEKLAGLDSEIEFVTFKVGDPENPHNWPMWLKWWYTFIISMFVISAAYGSSCLSGGLSTVNNKYHVLTEVSTLTVSLMVIGFCVGPLGPNVRRVRKKTHLLYIIRFVRHFQHSLCLVSKYWRIIGLPFLVWCFCIICSFNCWCKFGRYA